MSLRLGCVDKDINPALSLAYENCRTEVVNHGVQASKNFEKNLVINKTANKVFANQIINSNIDCQARFKSDKTKCSHFFSPQWKDVLVMLTNQKCMWNAKTKYEFSPPFDTSAEMFQEIKKIADSLRRA